MQPKIREVVLNHGDKVWFEPMHPHYGHAGFQVCPQYIRGKLKRVFIYPRQQDINNLVYRVELSGQDIFSVNSWTFKGIDKPDIWMTGWCKEHKCQTLSVYVPRNANHFSCNTGSFWPTLDFDYEEKK